MSNTVYGLRSAKVSMGAYVTASRVIRLSDACVRIVYPRGVLATPYQKRSDKNEPAYTLMSIRGNTVPCESVPTNTKMIPVSPRKKAAAHAKNTPRTGVSVIKNVRYSVNERSAGIGIGIVYQERRRYTENW